MPGPVAAANTRNGAGASAPAPAGFKLLELTVIGRGNLLAQGKFLMPSGLTIVGNVLRNRQDASKVFVLPAALRQPGGGYVQIVDFASQELREAWQLAALEAIRPRWKEIMHGAPARKEAGDGNF